MKCPFCEKMFDYSEKPALASQMFRRHVISCPKGTPEQRQAAMKSLREEREEKK